MTQKLKQMKDKTKPMQPEPQTCTANTTNSQHTTQGSQEMVRPSWEVRFAAKIGKHTNKNAKVEE